MVLDSNNSLNGKKLLLIIGGGIAAYKCLDLIRRVRERGMSVQVILTRGGEQFVTPLSLSALSGNKTYTDLFSLTDEVEMGHIRLSREADLILVAPASADMMAKMVAGIADNLATATLLASNRPVMIAPSMNTQMWNHPATRRNINQLTQDGARLISPASGDLACGEVGNGRLAEVADILTALEDFFAPKGPLAAKHILVTAGPTIEAIDPVRYLANRSSGKQGYAIAVALRNLGARVTLVCGPTNLDPPGGMSVIPVESARDMEKACAEALPAEAAICVAAVADWRIAETAAQKIKKQDGQLPSLALVENPDILAMLSKKSPHRPALVIGFAAETENVTGHAKAKRDRKGCDWIIANDISVIDGKSVMGGDHNRISLITESGIEDWDHAPKDEVAKRLARKIQDHFS